MNTQRVMSLIEHAKNAVDQVTLDFEERRRRRHVVETAGGEWLLIDLAQAPHLKDGQGLQLADGRIIEVRALPEPLIEITTDDPVRIAWHLGNRHLPTQIIGGKMRIREDHVIEAMLRGLDCQVIGIEAPFDPEGGAYGHSHGH